MLHMTLFDDKIYNMNEEYKKGIYEKAKEELEEKASKVDL